MSANTEGRAPVHTPLPEKRVFRLGKSLAESNIDPSVRGEIVPHLANKAAKFGVKSGPGFPSEGVEPDRFIGKMRNSAQERDHTVPKVNGQGAWRTRFA